MCKDFFFRSIFVFVASCLVFTTTTSVAVVDESFDVGINTIGELVVAIVIDEQGRIVFGGGFSEVKGVLRENIARVSAEGELDMSFAPTLDGPISSMHIMNDGKLLMLGDFQSVSGEPRQGIAILNVDGSLDGDFAPEFGDAEVTHAVVQSNNKIVLSVGEQPYLQNYPTTVIVNPQKLVRLNLDGSEDISFKADTYVSKLTAITVLDNNELVIADNDILGNVQGNLFLGDYNIKTFSANGDIQETIAINRPAMKLLATGTDEFIAVGCFSLVDYEDTNCDRYGCDTSGGIERSLLMKLDSSLAVDLSYNANNDFEGIKDANTSSCILNADQNSRSELFVVGNAGLQVGGFRRYAKISPTGNKHVNTNFQIELLSPWVVKFQSDDEILFGSSVVGSLGGLIRVSEEPSTCFPIKNLAGTVSIFCI